MSAEANVTTRGLTRLSFLASLGASAACGAPTPSGGGSTQSNIGAIEANVDLVRLMREHVVPGISVAVIRDFQLAWAKGYGATALGGSEPVTPETLFLAGSISKPVTAVGALALVDAGVLSLDEDVNLKLRHWRIPRNDYSSQPVTLGRLLDHTGGFTGGDFYPGYAVDEAVPSLLQILDGLPSARNPAVRVGSSPGSAWRYSGDGYLVVQQLMMDVTNEQFPQLMRERVFDRLAMRNSTFEQPLPPERASFAASGTLANG